MRTHFDQHIAQALGVCQQYADDVIPHKAPFTGHMDRIAPVDQVRFCVRRDHDVARVQVTMELVVHKNVFEQSEQEVLPQGTLEALALGALQAADGFLDGNGVVHVLHFQDATGGDKHIRHMPRPGHSCPRGEPALDGRFVLKIQFLLKAPGELLDLVRQRMEERQQLGVWGPELTAH